MKLTPDELYTLQDALISQRKDLFKSLENYKGPLGEQALVASVVIQLNKIINLHQKISDEIKVHLAAQRGQKV